MHSVYSYSLLVVYVDCVIINRWQLSLFKTIIITVTVSAVPFFKALYVWICFFLRLCHAKRAAQKQLCFAIKISKLFADFFILFYCSFSLFNDFYSEKIATHALVSPCILILHNNVTLTAVVLKELCWCSWYYKKYIKFD